MRILQGHIVSPAVWIRRFLKMMLWLCAWTSIIFFLDQAIMFNESITLDHMTVNNFDIQCPQEVTNGGSADCFSAKNAFVPECQSPSGYIPAHVDSLTCYEYRSMCVLTFLTALSRAAALFTILYGALIMIFAIALQGIRTRKRVKWMYAIPLGAFSLYLGTQALVQQTGVTALGALFPFATSFILLFLVKIRLAVEDVRESEQKEIDEMERDDNTKAR